MDRWAVLEHKTNGDRSIVLWDCQVIRDGQALQSGLVWIDKSCSFNTMSLVPRLESSPLIVIEFPEQLKGMATAQIMPEVIFKIVSINRSIGAL